MNNIVSTSTVELEGFYKFEVRNNGKIRHTHEQKNVLTDQFIIGMAQATNIGISYCYLSTSTATPLASATAMPSVVATDGINSSAYGTSGSGEDWYTDIYTVHAFAQNAYTGTVTAVGCGSSADGATQLASWLRIVDGGGVPSSLTLITGDQLTVTYVLRAKRPKVMTTGTITLAGVNYDWICWPVMISSVSGFKWQQWPGDWFDCVAGGASSFSSMSTPNILATISGTEIATNTWASFTRYAGQPYFDKHVNYNISESNGNIVAVNAGCLYDSGGATRVNIMCSFTPAIPKNNTQTLALTFRHTYVRV